MSDQPIGKIGRFYKSRLTSVLLLAVSVVCALFIWWVVSCADREIRRDILLHADASPKILTDIRLHADASPKILTDIRLYADRLSGTLLSSTRYVLAFGNVFALTAIVGQEFWRMNPERAGWLSIVIGFMLTALVSVLVGMTIRRRDKLESLVATKTSQLRESEALQRSLLANLPAGVIIVDPTTRVIESVNAHVAALFGASVDHLIGQRCHSFLCPAAEGACPVCDLGQAVDNADRVMLCADGSRLPILKTVKRIRLDG